jgi:transposase InsO family protein
MGIQAEFTDRGRPQDNAAEGQIHRVYKAEPASPPAANAQAQQRRTPHEQTTQGNRDFEDYARLA